MEKEIDLRSLIFGNLDYSMHDVSPYSLCNSNSINLINRPFETGREWTRVEQTSYIESIFLHCSLQPIIRFFNYNHTVIVDGYNRYMAICNFCNNKLVLDEKGLKQLRFLANKKFDSLSESEKQYFKKCGPIKILDYSYKGVNSNKLLLTSDEEIEIERYLHVIYNTGLRLEIEEIQKAEFSDDYLTKKIREKLDSDEEFISILESFRLFNGRKKRNKIDNILLNCRLLIASTYSNMNKFCSTYSIEERIGENYLPNLENLDLNKVFQDFLLNVNQIYNNLIDTQKWLVYPILHSKPFLDATYWLISVIRKDKLGDPFCFDFMKYLEYFGEIEEQVRNFNPFQAHYKKNIFNKYFVVAKYYEKEYGVDMSSYFKEVSDEKSNVKVINNIEELYNNHFNFHPESIKVSDLLVDLETGSYNLRPYYQRKEVMNTLLSSRIIESLLLGIRIPYILVCNKYYNGNFITEVVDGQQRILAILGYLQQPFMNEKGDIDYSNKNGYALKELRILSEFNNFKSKSVDGKNVLSELDLKKILDAEIDVSKTIEGDKSNFSAVDHFVRLNKNVCTIKENTYRMWSLTSDRKIIDYEKNITREFIGNILPKVNQKRTANMITIKLACLFYHRKFDEITFNGYSNLRVSSWLKDFNKCKDKYMYKDTQKIGEERKLYFDALDEVKCFYLKINDFVCSLDKSFRDLTSLTGYGSIPLSNYYYLFCMLGSISREDLLDNNIKIYDIIKDFFVKIRIDKLDNSSILNLLNFTVQQVAVFDSSKRYEFRDKLSMAIKGNC